MSEHLILAINRTSNLPNITKNRTVREHRTVRSTSRVYSWLLLLPWIWNREITMACIYILETRMETIVWTLTEFFQATQILLFKHIDLSALLFLHKFYRPLICQVSRKNDLSQFLGWGTSIFLLDSCLQWRLDDILHLPVWNVQKK